MTNETAMLRPGFGIAKDKEIKLDRPVSTMTPYRYSWADVKYENDDTPAHGYAKSSLGYGVASCLFSRITLIGFIFGIIGLAKASKARRMGDRTDTRAAGIMFSLLGILGSLILTAVLAFCIIGGAITISRNPAPKISEKITEVFKD